MQRFNKVKEAIGTSTEFGFFIDPKAGTAILEVEGEDGEVTETSCSLTVEEIMEFMRSR